MKPDARKEIADLLGDWIAAIETGDAGNVAELYAPDALLLPTMSNEIRRTTGAIRDYFRNFLTKKPKGRIVQQNIRRFDALAVTSGIYGFTLLAGGVSAEALYRFTIVYRAEDDGGWKIIEHHSSVMPE